MTKKKFPSVRRLVTYAAAGAALLVPCYCVGELLYVAAKTPRLPRAPGPRTGLASPQAAKEKEEDAERERGRGWSWASPGRKVDDSGAGEKRPLRLLALGDSAAVGCGLQSNEEACAGTFARATERALGKAVVWEVVGKNGANAKQMEEKFVPKIGEWCHARPDRIVRSVGVNNLLEMQREANFERDLTSLLRAITEKVDGHSCIVVL